MCLLIVAPAGKGADLTDVQLKDFYRRNDDGYGFMYVEDRQLKVHKSLGKVEEFIEDWRRFADRDRAVHLRMRTHGNIDLDNTHPYWVVDEGETQIALMHNGILRTGNSKDTTKSDTWHFIKDYLEPMLIAHPELMTNEGFSNLVAETIGSSNKFVLMDANANVLILNQQAGTRWNGMWFSNTYAWSLPSEVTGITYGKGWHGNRGRSEHSSSAAYGEWGYGGYEGYEGYEGYGGYRGYSTRELAAAAAASQKALPAPKGSESTKEVAEGTKEADRETAVGDAIHDALRTDPKVALDFIDSYRFWTAGRVTLKEISTYVDEVGGDVLWELIELLTDGSIDENVFLQYVQDKINARQKPPPMSKELADSLGIDEAANEPEGHSDPVHAPSQDETTPLLFGELAAPASVHSNSEPLVTPEQTVAALPVPVSQTSGVQE